MKYVIRFLLFTLAVIVIFAIVMLNTFVMKLLGDNLTYVIAYLLLMIALAVVVDIRLDKYLAKQRAISQQKFNDELLEWAKTMNELDEFERGQR